MDATQGSTRSGSLAALSVSVLLASLGTSSANVMLPVLAPEFDATFGAVQWVVLAYLLAMTTLVVGVGRLGDLFGRVRLLTAGLVLFLVASVLAAAAPSLSFLIGARALQGLGAAAMTALAMAVASETTSKGRAGRAMGLLGSMSAAGTALGPALAGLLVTGPGWRAVFLANVPLAIAAIALARNTLPADARSAAASRARFDGKGTLLLAATLVAYALATTSHPGTGMGMADAGLLGVALVGLVLFVRAESRAASPLVRLALFRDPVVAGGFVTSALVTSVVMVTLVVGPFHLAHGLGLSTVAVGAVLSIGPIVVALAGVPAGRSVDRWGAPTVSMAGLVVMAGGAVGLALLPDAIGVAGYVSSLATLTAGYAFFQAANNTGVMADVAHDARGVVASLLALARNLGLITGASAMGALFALASGASDARPLSALASAAGWRITLLASAGLIVVALVVASACAALAARARAA